MDTAAAPGTLKVPCIELQLSHAVHDRGRLVARTIVTVKRAAMALVGAAQRVWVSVGCNHTSKHFVTICKDRKEGETGEGDGGGRQHTEHRGEHPNQQRQR